MQKVVNIFDVLRSYTVKEDGTYSLETGMSIEYDDGYQVSFVRPEAFVQLNNQDWDDLTNYYCAYFDSIAHIGVYSGSAEVSFRSIPIERAVHIMEEYNQESILDWEKKKEYPDLIENWFIININFDEKKVVDYGKILNAIQ